MQHRDASLPQPSLSPIPLTEGTSGDSVRVRPSRSAARLADTTVGGDTGWTVGAVTVGANGEDHHEGEANGDWLGLSGGPGLRG